MSDARSVTWLCFFICRGISLWYNANQIELLRCDKLVLVFEPQQNGCINVHVIADDSWYLMSWVLWQNR